MKKILLYLVIALSVPVAQTWAADVGVSIGINAGAPPPPGYAQPPVVITEPPEFVAPPQLGFYIAVGVPYDLFYFGSQYYLYRGGISYAAPYYNGPWVIVPYGRVPYDIRRHPFNSIHRYRDYYYSHPRNYGGHEFGHFRPEHRNPGRERHEGAEHGRGGGNHAGYHGEQGRGGGEHGEGYHGHRN